MKCRGSCFFCGWRRTKSSPRKQGKWKSLGLTAPSYSIWNTKQLNRRKPLWAPSVSHQVQEQNSNSCADPKDGATEPRSRDWTYITRGSAHLQPIQARALTCSARTQSAKSRRKSTGQTTHTLQQTPGKEEGQHR